MIKVLNKETNYWLVRTAGGEYYDQFVAFNFIAIGWNEISDLDLIRQAKEDETKKEKILKQIRELVDKEAKMEVQPKGEREREAQKSRIYNQINRFVNEMKVGDYVLIPSKNSNLIEFGIITSDVYIRYIDELDLYEDSCEFIKRRDVTWLHRKKRYELDPYLYGLIYSQHAISSANEYAQYIDRTINKLYVKDNQAHIVFEIGKQTDIYGIELIRLINNTLDLIDVFNKITGSNLNKEMVQIKINVQSPGLIEFFGHIEEIFIIALVIAAILGGKVQISKLIEFQTPGLLEKVKQFIENYLTYNLEKEKIALLKSQQTLQIKNPPELQINNQEDEKEKD